MKKLNDITIYYSGNKIPQTPIDWTFRRLANYVCDLYHQKSNKYKPLKTSRITIHLNHRKIWEHPDYFGAICSVYADIDENKYFGNSELENKKYLLEIIHNSIKKAAKAENWETADFDNAYNEILKADFKFEIIKPFKISKDKKVVTPIIEKSLTESHLNIILKYNNIEKKVCLITKENHSCYDSIYLLADKVKWFNNEEVGLEIKDLNVKVVYSIKDNELKSNLTYNEYGIIIAQQ